MTGNGWEVCVDLNRSVGNGWENVRFVGWGCLGHCVRDPEMLLLFICYTLSQILFFKHFIHIFLEYMIYLTPLVILNSLRDPLQFKWRKVCSVGLAGLRFPDFVCRILQSWMSSQILENNCLFGEWLCCLLSCITCKNNICFMFVSVDIHVGQALQLYLCSSAFLLTLIGCACMVI